MRILKHPWEDDIFIAKRSSVQQLTIMVGMTERVPLLSSHIHS